MSDRLCEAQVTRGLWEECGPTAALKHIISRGDEAVAVDFLNAVIPRGFPRVTPPRSGGGEDRDDGEWVELLCEVLKALLKSRFEE